MRPETVYLQRVGRLPFRLLQQKGNQQVGASFHFGGKVGQACVGHMRSFDALNELVEVVGDLFQRVCLLMRQLVKQQQQPALLILCLQLHLQLHGFGHLQPVHGTIEHSGRVYAFAPTGRSVSSAVARLRFRWLRHLNNIHLQLGEYPYGIVEVHSLNSLAKQHQTIGLLPAGVGW